MNNSKWIVGVTLTVIVGGLTPANALPGQRDRDTFPWSKAAGHPSMGDRPGIYVWHDGDTVNIVSQSEHPKTAAIHVVVRDGRINDVRRLHDERGDTIVFARDNAVEFKSRTNDGRDEIRFHIVNGKSLVLNLKQPWEKDRPLFIGGQEIRTDRNNVVFNLNR